MIRLFLSLLLGIGMATAAENNASKKDANLTQATQKHIQEQLEREQKYAKEQKFYQGKEYNLSEHKVTKDQLEAVPLIEPYYDFDITDVYRDDI